MHKHTLAIIGILSVVAMAWLVTPKAEAQGGFHLGFGKMLAGTYLSDVTVTAIDGVPVGLPPFRDITNFTADGTQTSTDETDAGGNPFLMGLDSPRLGSWKKIGPHKIASEQLGFSYDTSGVLIGSVRSKAVGTFSSDFQMATIDFEVQVFGPTDDPLTGTPVSIIEGSALARRLNVGG